MNTHILSLHKAILYVPNSKPQQSREKRVVRQSVGSPFVPAASAEKPAHEAGRKHAQNALCVGRGRV